MNWTREIRKYKTGERMDCSKCKEELTKDNKMCPACCNCLDCCACLQSEADCYQKKDGNHAWKYLGESSSGCRGGSEETKICFKCKLFKDHDYYEWDDKERKPTILDDKCVGCQLCLLVCPVYDCITPGKILFKEEDQFGKGSNTDWKEDASNKHDIVVGKYDRP